MENLPRVSCIVRTKNSSATLARCLTALRQQSIPPAEIIVVDNGSKDESKEIARSHGAVIVDYPSGEPFNFARSINLGIHASRGDFLWIVSSHVIVESRDTLSALLEAMQDPALAGAYSAHTRLAVTRPKSAPPIEKINFANFSGFNGLHNYCSLIRRGVWAERPFNEKIATAEDQDWALWCYRQKNLFTAGVFTHPVSYLNPNDSLWKSARERAIAALLIRSKRSPFISGLGFLRRALKALLHGGASSARADAWAALLIGHALLLGIFHKKPRWLLIT